MKNVKVMPFVKTCHYNADSLNELMAQSPELGSMFGPSLPEFCLCAIDVQGAQRTLWQWLTCKPRRWCVRLTYRSTREPAA